MQRPGRVVRTVACMLLLGAHSGKKERTPMKRRDTKVNARTTYNYKVGTCMMKHLARLDAAVLLINVHARTPADASTTVRAATVPVLLINRTTKRSRINRVPSV